MTMDFQQARFNMVEQQIRTWEVLDQDVLDALQAVPRDAFVPEDFRLLAYSRSQSANRKPSAARLSSR